MLTDYFLAERAGGAKRCIKMEDMSIEMVGTWLDSIGCDSTVIDCFRDSEIDGDALLSLDEDALRGEILLTENGFSGSQISQVIRAKYQSIILRACA